MSVVNFVLEQFESSTTLSVTGAMTSSAVPALPTDARGVYYITQTQAKNIFKFQTDSFDISNNPTSDIKYYTHYSAFTALGLNPANAMMNIAGSNAIATVDATGANLAANKMLVAHDFLRHMALDLFGTHLGVDLFNNETQLIQNIRTLCSDSSGNVMDVINTHVANVSTTSTSNIAGLETDASGSKYMSNANTSSANLCRVLFNQMVNQTPARFASIVPTQYQQSLPFIVGDTISFKLTINPASGQRLLTRPNSAVEVASRSYEIRLEIIDDSDVVKVNTTPSSDEL